MRPRLLILLQNPWAKGRLRSWNPGVWRKEFGASRTGIRLFNEVIPSDKYLIFFANVDPRISPLPNAIPEPNVKHVVRRIKKVRPDVILVCGNVALAVIGHSLLRDVLGGISVISMQHPASRALSAVETKSMQSYLYNFAKRWYTVKCFSEA